MDDFHIDGFRWDAVGAMRYYDPGHVNIPEADSLIQYINNTEIRANRPGVISIAEDEAYGQGFHGEWDRGFGDLLIQQVVEGTDANRDMNALWNAMNGSGFFRVAYSETPRSDGRAQWVRQPAPAHPHSARRSGRLLRPQTLDAGRGGDHDHAGHADALHGPGTAGRRTIQRQQPARLDARHDLFQRRQLLPRSHSSAPQSRRREPRPHRPQCHQPCRPQRRAVEAPRRFIAMARARTTR